MPSETTPLVSSTLKKGTYAPAGPNDKRSPCPLVNALANHGYIPRDGKNVHASELQAGISEVGMSSAICAIMANAVVNEYQDPKTAYLRKKPGLFTRLWNFLRNPWSILSFFGVRRPRQVDSKGRKVIDLDQLAIHGVIEHDISMSRRDYLQKAGCAQLQPDLVEDLLNSSSDGGKTLTAEDMCAFRKRRIQRQFDENPGLQYGPAQHTTACGEVAMILGLLGNGKSVPCSYVRAFMLEERFPTKEGWKKRWWWTMGLVELAQGAMKIKNMIGLEV